MAMLVRSLQPTPDVVLPGCSAVAQVGMNSLFRSDRSRFLGAARFFSVRGCTALRNRSLPK